jgi:chromosome segregation ATPase
MNNEVESFPGELATLRRQIAELQMIPDRSLTDEKDLVFRLRKRAEIRRRIPGRKSVEEGTPDRIAAILEEAADELAHQRRQAEHFQNEWSEVCNENQVLLNKIADLENELESISAENSKFLTLLGW